MVKAVPRLVWVSFGAAIPLLSIVPALAQKRPRVPARPPDTVWVDVWANEDPAWEAPVDVFLLTFRPNVTVERKRAVIGAMDGEVVGGMPASRGSPIEGMYLVRVSTSDVESLLDVIEQVREAPEVLGASLLLRMGIPRGARADTGRAGV